MLCLELDEVVRLLKSRGIELGSPGANDPTVPVDVALSEKDKVWVKHQKRKARNTERHVLKKEMALRHEIPALFVSKRSDGGVNGFNCAICRKDVSFLSKGEAEIWRHYLCKSHYALDRRYRYDHEDVIFLRDLVSVRVEDVSEELRDEILETPSVTLGPKYPFDEDAVDGIVGVQSRVPASTLVGCLLELLRTGGSQSLLRRLWALFRSTLGGGTYSVASWSKTETLTVLGQTLYPRIIRRAMEWICSTGMFSLKFDYDPVSVRCFVVFWEGDNRRQVCVLWESLREEVVAEHSQSLSLTPGSN